MFQMKSLVKMCVYQVHLHACITFEDYTIFKNLATSLRNLTSASNVCESCSTEILVLGPQRTQ